MHGTLFCQVTEVWRRWQSTGPCSGKERFNVDGGVAGGGQKWRAAHGS